MENIIVVEKKKKGFTEPFDREKIHVAIRKSASRVLRDLTDQECMKVSDHVLKLIGKSESVTVRRLHRMVEVSLDESGFPRVAESYRQYRNYKEDALRIMEAVDAKTLELSYKEDVSNANANSALVSTTRSILFGEQQKEKYKRIFLSPVEAEAHDAGFIYIHDMKDRLSTFNCCIFNISGVLKDGFRLEGIDYTEPKSLGAAMSVTADLVSSAAGQQYGGFTLGQVDEVWEPYAELSYQFYIDQYRKLVEDSGGTFDDTKADQFAVNRVTREIEQHYQQIEHSMNSIASSRGDFAFVTFSLGHGTGRWAKLISETILRTRRGGQGKPGRKVPVLFPKLVFLYDTELHGPGKECESVYNEAVKTARETMYPDFLSLDSGYVGDMYKKTGKIISPMGKW